MEEYLKLAKIETNNKSRYEHMMELDDMMRSTEIASALSYVYSALNVRDIVWNFSNAYDFSPLMKRVFMGWILCVRDQNGGKNFASG